MGKQLRVLVLIDLINDFFPGGKLAANGAHEIIPIINKLMKDGNYDAIIAVNDAHPRGHVSFYSSHAGRAVHDEVKLAYGVVQHLWPEHGEKGTWGAQFHPDLDTDRIDYVLEKGTNVEIDSYSGFYDNARKGETELRQTLDNLAAKNDIPRSNIHLHVAGLVLPYCPTFTAKDGKQIGYDVSLIVDATRSILAPGQREEDLLRDLVDAGVSISSSNEVLSEFPREIPRTQALQP